MEEEQLIRYIKGDRVSETELTQILDWIESSEENREQYNQLKNLWVLSGLDMQEEASSERFFRKKTMVFKPTFARSVLKYAAIFLLAFLAGAGVLYFSELGRFSQLSETYNEVMVPLGEKSHITLYDGTKVWLNSGSTLKYPVAFAKNQRNIFLEGEAYFDVVSNKDQPFIVNTNQLTVEVLGTKFNVCAYQDDEECQVTLEEGSVRAESLSKDQLVVLSPGEQAIFSRKNNQLRLVQVDPFLYSSWKENLLRFEDTPFREVVKKMEHWYGVRISFDETIDPEDAFTMSIKTESLREMLDLIAKTIPVKYDINGNKVRITRQ